MKRQAIYFCKVPKENNILTYFQEGFMLQGKGIRGRDFKSQSTHFEKQDIKVLLHCIGQ